LLLNGVLLCLSAVFVYDWRSQLVTALLLFLPFVDPNGSQPKTLPYSRRGQLNLLLIASISLLLYFYPDQQNLIISTLVFTALPEEWFFRAYVMTRLECLMQDIKQQSKENKAFFVNLTSKNTANIVASFFFTLLHLPTQGLWGLLVFFPSLFFGWLYQKNNDLLLVILVHALSNLMLYLFILPWI